MSILFVSAQPQPPAIDGPHNEKAAPTIIFKHSAPRDNSNWSRLWTRLKPFFWEEPEFSLMGEHKLEDKGRRFPRLPTFYKDNGGGCFHTLIVGQLSGVGGSGGLLLNLQEQLRGRLPGLPHSNIVTMGAKYLITLAAFLKLQILKISCRFLLICDSRCVQDHV